MATRDRNEPCPHGLIPNQVGTCYACLVADARLEGAREQMEKDCLIVCMVCRHDAAKKIDPATKVGIYWDHRAVQCAASDIRAAWEKEHGK